jgi:hypothetical protein
MAENAWDYYTDPNSPRHSVASPSTGASAAAAKIKAANWPTMINLTHTPVGKTLADVNAQANSDITVTLSHLALGYLK